MLAADAPETRPPATTHAAILPRGVVLRPRDADTRFLLQPGGSFAAIVFRDDTPADHLGLVYVGSMPEAGDGAWSADSRFWQEPLWSADVNALVWSPDGAALFVSTGDQGSGGVFRLDLHTRRARRLWPNDETSAADQGQGRSCEIMNADAERKLLHVRYEAASQRGPMAVDVKME